MTQHPLELTPAQLAYHCDVSHFTFKDTSSLPAERTIYGQPRGVSAIDFGLAIDSPGYNIYVLGPVDSLRVGLVRQYLEAYARTRPTPEDWCYVYNFKVEHRPRALQLPAGQGRVLKADMNTFIKALQTDLPQALNSDTFQEARNHVSGEFESQRHQIIAQVQQMAHELHFALQTTEQGVLVIVPIAEGGQPLQAEEIAQLTPETQQTMETNRRRLEEAVNAAFRQIQGWQSKARETLDNLYLEIAKQVVDAHLGGLLQKYASSEAVTHYLDEVRADILESLDLFVGNEEESTPEEPPTPQDQLRRYEINVFVEHDPEQGAPVELADFPSYRNLVGRIEHEARFGVLSTDFTLIKSGALQRANGGFLVLRVPDILQQPLSWAALKRALVNSQVAIEDVFTTGTSVMATQTLEPAPIPLKLTVVLIGQQALYYTLYEVEEDFRDLFRVKADFGDAIKRDAQAEQHYANFIASHCQANGWKHFNKAAVGRLVEYGCWLVSDQHKLSTDFAAIASLMREAVYFAEKNKHKTVKAEDVDQAIQERIFRNNELEELSQERIADGSVFIDVKGAVVGQINGLVVITVGDHTFGLPSRLTARVYMGRDGIVHVDRESEMTGRLHDKGVRILEGYLGGHYAHEYPLSLSASITFEQNYAEVEGDSASSTELFVLLSALSGFPLRQDLAVTGSVNQHGQIQIIGGVTQKIEGFFTTCKSRGLTGTQGVIIPKANMRDLMLNREVIQAVEKGKFHIYAIETVDEGIALLTGQSAEAVHEAVDRRLLELARKMEDFGGKGEGEEEPVEEA